MNTQLKKSFKQAAIDILKAEQAPLSATEITERALQMGLLSTEGQTPEVTMAAQLYVDIRDNKQSKFKKVGKGLFALREQTDSLETPQLVIEKHNALVKDALTDKLYEMDPFLFERLIADLLAKIGYESVEVTKSSGDKGIDVEALLTMDGITSVKTVVQVKRYKKGANISGAVVTQLRGSAEVDQRGLVITTSDFTKDAKREAQAPNKMPVSLINGEKLLSLLVKYNVGTKSENVTVYSLDSEYFDNEESVAGKHLDTHKHRSLWPLPGGTDSYVDTLFSVMDLIAQGEVSRSDLVNWFMHSFESVSSEKAAQNYANVPQKMGLIRFGNDQVFFTEAGRMVYDTKDTDLLYGVISKNILAFDDVFEFLRTTKTPQTEKDILTFLKSSFDIEWSTHAQVNFRLLWLKNLNKVEKRLEGYTVKTSHSKVTSKST